MMLLFQFNMCFVDFFLHWFTACMACSNHCSTLEPPAVFSRDGFLMSNWLLSVGLRISWHLTTQWLVAKSESISLGHGPLVQLDIHLVTSIYYCDIPVPPVALPCLVAVRSAKRPQAHSRQKKGRARSVTLCWSKTAVMRKWISQAINSPSKKAKKTITKEKKSSYLAATKTSNKNPSYSRFEGCIWMYDFQFGILEGQNKDSRLVNTTKVVCSTPRNSKNIASDKMPCQQRAIAVLKGVNQMGIIQYSNNLPC